ncbi:methyltransferase [candidate division KSB1 bacterium]|nr:methyltransferase [candidate division KSB1 bacterium]
MTPRERVIAALNHQEPDKVPIDLGAMGSTGIMAIAYNQLKKHLGMTGGSTRIVDVGQQLAEPEPAILERFQVDVISLNHTRGANREQWKDWTLPDGSVGQIYRSAYPVRRGTEWVFMSGETVTSRMPEGCLYFEPCYWSMEHASTRDAIEKHPWFYFTDEHLKRLEQKAQQLFTGTDYAIMGAFGGSILEAGQGLRGWSNFMMDLVLNRAFVEDLMDKMVEVYLKNLEGYLQAVGDRIQIIQMGDDLGTQNAPQMAPDLYREMIKPRHKKIYRYVKQHSNLFVFLHSCGSIYELIPDLIDAGIDILNPVQTSARNMEPGRLKAEFGDRLTFWGGGVDTQHVLPDCSPEEIAEHVKERINIFAPCGGFVFTQVHNIQANVPPENIIAAYDTACLQRNYPVV